MTVKINRTHGTCRQIIHIRLEITFYVKFSIITRITTTGGYVFKKFTRAPRREQPIFVTNIRLIRPQL